MSAPRPQYEVADVVRLFGDMFTKCHSPSAAEKKVLRHIEMCRTEQLGGHVDACSNCGVVRISYNSCRDRHCPKCQSTTRDKWLESRFETLLPTPYFHVVFTIPAELNALVLGNKRTLYKLLFQAASRTLLSLANDSERLGAQIGFTAVLHTWGQNLSLHPHLHCIVTGGGLSSSGMQWVQGNPKYLFPVHVLSDLFRGKFMAALEKEYNCGQLSFNGSTTELDDPMRWAQLRDQLYRKRWIVYAKRPFGGPERVYRYLGQYTHRVAISNWRIIEIRDKKVTFSVKNYRKRGKKTQMSLDGCEFLRRYLLHVLPKGFVRIRHYGLFASVNVPTKLALAKRLFKQEEHNTVDTNELDSISESWSPNKVSVCPHCKRGHFVLILTIPMEPMQCARPP